MGSRKQVRRNAQRHGSGSVRQGRGAVAQRHPRWMESPRPHTHYHHPVAAV